MRDRKIIVYKIFTKNFMNFFYHKLYWLFDENSICYDKVTLIEVKKYLEIPKEMVSIKRIIIVVVKFRNDNFANL